MSGKPWSIVSVDVEIRQKFVGMAKMQGKSVTEAIQQAMTDWISKTEKKIAM